MEKKKNILVPIIIIAGAAVGGFFLVKYLTKDPADNTTEPKVDPKTAPKEEQEPEVKPTPTTKQIIVSYMAKDKAFVEAPNANAPILGQLKKSDKVQVLAKVTIGGTLMYYKVKVIRTTSINVKAGAIGYFYKDGITTTSKETVNA